MNCAPKTLILLSYISLYDYLNHILELKVLGKTYKNGDIDPLFCYHSDLHSTHTSKYKHGREALVPFLISFLCMKMNDDCLHLNKV
jgi:hypothetical protein